MREDFFGIVSRMTFPRPVLRVNLILGIVNYIIYVETSVISAEKDGGSLGFVSGNVEEMVCFGELVDFE